MHERENHPAPVAPDHLNDMQTNPPTTSDNPNGISPIFIPDGSGSVMLLQVTYLVSFFGWPLFSGSTATCNGTTGTAIVSNAPF